MIIIGEIHFGGRTAGSSYAVPGFKVFPLTAFLIVLHRGPRARGKVHDHFVTFGLIIT